MILEFSSEFNRQVCEVQRLYDKVEAKCPITAHTSKSEIRKIALDLLYSCEEMIRISPTNKVKASNKNLQFNTDLSTPKLFLEVLKLWEMR